jgi:hypothetical protein
MSETFITVGAVGFISTLAPQYTHPLLKTETTWTPLVTRHEIMLKVAEACGSAFLTWKKPDLDPLAEKTYINAMTSLMEYMDSSILSEDDHTWIGAACQLMSVGAERIWNFKPEYIINSLRGSYKLKLRESDLITDPSSPQKPRSPKYSMKAPA